MALREFISRKYSFSTIFAPIYIIQTILSSSRVNIREHDVTTVTVGQKLYSFMWLVAVTLSFWYFAAYFYKVYYNYNTILYVTCTLGILIQYFSYIADIIHARFWSAQLYVKLYLLLKKVDRDLNLIDSQYSKDFHYYLNLLISLLIIVLYECGFGAYVISTIEYPLLTVFMGFGLLIIYFDVLLTASLIYYITIRLGNLNKIIKYNVFMKYGNPGKKKDHQLVNDNLNLFLISCRDNGGFKLTQFTMSLKNILKLYKIITEVSSFPVFIVATKGFFWTFFAIESMVVGIRSEMVNVMAMVPIGLWVLFYFIQISTLAIINDWFIQEVKKTKLLCIDALSFNLDDSPVRYAVKDIIRTIQFGQPEFCVYGVFVLDKILPLKLIGVITTNVLVLIQFTV